MLVGADPQTNENVREAAPPGAHVECAPSFFPGDWDAVVISSRCYFSHSFLKNGQRNACVMVFGPAHLFRSAWLAGAHDYLRDPWHPDELFLRLRGPQLPIVNWAWDGGIFALEGREVSRQGRGRLRLSPAEAGILRLLILRRGLVVSRATLAWEAGCEPNRVVDTLVSRLRKQLSELVDSQADSIHAVRGVGYRFP